jgi:MscS family membrane protein
MDIWTDLTEIKFAENELWRIAALFIVLLIALAIGRVAKFILVRIARKFEDQNRPMAAAAVNALARAVILLAAAFGISLGIPILVLSEGINELLVTLADLLLVVSFGYAIYWLVDVPHAFLARLAEKSESKLDDMMVPVMRRCLRITIVILVLVQIAQILSDKPITSIIAGLGIGSLAIALAAQDSLKNFFGSLIIFTDKPFELGDRIVVDGFDGPVEDVGLRSTKIRTLDGHLVTIPNGELANKFIKNIGKRPFIKRVANITVTYDTSSEKLDQAIDILKEILDNHEGMNEEKPPRVFFNEFNDASLNIIVLYWFHPPDFIAYLEFTEKFNKEVFRRFNEEGIEFAFPTQTLYLAGDPKRPLNVGLDQDLPQQS